MLHTYAARFDMIRSLEFFFLFLGGTKQDPRVFWFEDKGGCGIWVIFGL
jgi:hypothetical protein